MSIDLNWETLTAGPDGEALAESIRDFIHTKFQSVPLPRFIKSVTVHDFSFGGVPPELELKDITDPLPEFYELDPDEDDDDDEEEEEEEEIGDGDGNGDADAEEWEWEGEGEGEELVPEAIKTAAERRRRARRRAGTGAGDGGGSKSGRGAALHHHHHNNNNLGRVEIPPAAARRGGVVERDGRGSPMPNWPDHLGTASSPMFFGGPGALTPGIPGGTTNMHYFHSHHFASGTQTPLLAAAAAGAAGGHKNGGYGFGIGGAGDGVHHSASSPELRPQGLRRAAQAGNGASGHARHTSSGSIPSVGDEMGSPPMPHVLREKHSVSTLAPTSAGTSRPPTRENGEDEDDGMEGERTPGVGGEGEDGGRAEGERPRFREPRVEDMQAVFRIRYAGDVKLLLTADILLDYPMPSFVGIPVRLSITGLTFDGVGVLAKIRKRAHFCFLSPEDAVAAVGGEENKEEVEGGRHPPGHGAAGGSGRSTKIGGLLQEIRVESEIGQREGGKQSLKNVGKVERFVLEQVRRIFEEEFVYPSFWTFLV